MGRSRNKSSLDLRTQTAWITDLVNPPRLNDIRKEKGCPPVFRILPVEIASALLELPAHLDKHPVADACLGTRPVKRRPLIGR